jgi:hypothetical protein
MSQLLNSTNINTPNSLATTLDRVALSVAQPTVASS